jgi:hypothetical protein
MPAFILKPARILLALTAIAQAYPALAADTGRSDGDEPIILEDIVTFMETPEVKPYHYGMHLDIEKVVSIKYFPPEPNYCGVIPAQMVYEDSHGELNAIEYLYPDTSCPNMN